MNIKEGIADIIKDEAGSGYLHDWDVYEGLLDMEQQRDYFLKVANVIMAYLRSQGVVRKVAERECICGGVSSYINSEKMPCPYCNGSKKFIEVEEI